MRHIGKTALVTGAGRGIGKGCALEMARQGADLVINDRPGSPDLSQIASEVRTLGRKCTPIEADVFNRAGCEGLVAKSLEAVGQIDILVSNPSCNKRSTFLDYDPADFERIIQGVLVSGFHVSQLVARHMVERGVRGKILFISSVHAPVPYANNCAYNAGKAGLNHFCRTVAVELARHRINVNAIEPGWIDTPGERTVFGDKVIETEGAKLSWVRIGTIEDIGRAASFLCSDEADYISGSILRVDGLIVFKDCAEEF
jgi:glucose 1-dehydrogenase